MDRVKGTGLHVDLKFMAEEQAQGTARSGNGDFLPLIVFLSRAM